MDNETIKEVMKATVALSPTVNNASDLFKKLTSSPFEELGGLVSDYLKRARIINWIKFKPKLIKCINESGIDSFRENIPSRVVYDLIEGISREDNDDMQELWSRLTKNILDPNSNIDFTGWQIGVLKQLTALEVCILQKLFFATPEEQDMFRGGFPTIGLPKTFLTITENNIGKIKPVESTQTAIWHLIGLGLLVDPTFGGAGHQIDLIGLTSLGHALVRDCT